MKAWYSAVELAGLPGMPTTERRVHAMAERLDWSRRKKARGKGWEYASRCLPELTRAHLVVQAMTAAQDALTSSTDGSARDGRHHHSPEASAEAWARFERLPQKSRDEAARRLGACEAALTLIGGGMAKMGAYQAVAAGLGEHPATLRRWLGQVGSLARPDWLPRLAPGYVGRTATAECSPEAWDVFKADVLRLEAPGLVACYDRLTRTARERGWRVPSLRTLKRRLAREIPKAVRVLARGGREALERLYPAQRRDRSVFHALEAVNADGHKWDVFVRWPDGVVGRPMLVAFQDLYSGLILSWRVDRAESAELVRLAFGDLVERYGIPSECYLDNGRAFASKHITGGMATRYRFKVKVEEPAGILTQLGVRVHWATPYHGQAKPIERAFGDFCERIATHPAFAGSYTGNSPVDKPENYASKAVPLADFLHVIESEINAHNQRPGRRTAVCAGRSFAQVFAASYAEAPIRKATAEQRRLWLLAAEGVRAQQPSGHVELLGNRFWTEALAEHTGQKLIVRFDPQQLQQPVHVYRLDGRYIGAAECIADAGFNDIEAAKTHTKARKSFVHAQRDVLAAERRLSAAEVAAMLPDVEAPEIPNAKVIRPAFGRGLPAPEPIADFNQDENDRAFQRAVAMLERGAKQRDG